MLEGLHSEGTFRKLSQSLRFSFTIMTTGVGTLILLMCAHLVIALAQASLPS